ncbi:hypothetical protein [Burkholderia sp. TSV86]|uniref:hypothetical protein n=1 Tax=Burkholderia sp. TSV86 TaxID=1385594 RepID=UPI0007555AC0|nr:hypothetical protein [Burkholderia sp. TSV86]KVE34252.1 hypothetical protein WS68_09625 [Burkholderia sp. TSV86]
MTAQTENNPAPKVQTVWSANNEDFSCDELCGLLDMHDDLTVGNVVFVGEAKSIPAKHLCDADDVINLIGERAYDEVGEYADDYPDVTAEAIAELDALLAGWIEKHAKPTFYKVVNVREYTIAAADMEGRE